jgi:hypothetical protein
VAWHQAARSLHARLVQLLPAAQAQLLATVSHDVLIVTGPPRDLPWVPGIAYATRCAEAPALWRPTLQKPDVPLDLLARALQRRHRREPLLLWPEPAAVVPLDRQQRVTPELLELIAGRWQVS